MIGEYAGLIDDEGDKYFCRNLFSFFYFSPKSRKGRSHPEQTNLQHIPKESRCPLFQVPFPTCWCDVNISVSKIDVGRELITFICDDSYEWSKILK